MKKGENRMDTAISASSIPTRAESRHIQHAIFLASCLVLISSAANGATLHVCKKGCEYALIQDAINASASGDKINVGAGTFFENLSVKSKSVAITGAGEDFTVVDGGFYGTTVSVGDNDALADAGSLTLYAVTVTHGAAGGIHVNPASTLNLQNSIVISNQGGGIVNAAGTVTVGGSIIAHNKSSWLGGGISNSSDAHLTVSNSTIARNTASGGGGIFVDNLTFVTITGSTLADNTANGSAGAGLIGTGEGGAILITPRDVHSPSGVLAMTTTALVDNHASLEGGGLFAQQFTPPASVILGGNTPDNCGGGAICTPP
jgi:hypothetical protein